MPVWSMFDPGWNYLIPNHSKAHPYFPTLFTQPPGFNTSSKWFILLTPVVQTGRPGRIGSNRRGSTTVQTGRAADGRVGCNQFQTAQRG